MAAKRRMRRLNRRLGGGRPQLILVSMIDILTILVFFLLASQTDVGIQLDTRGANLPHSVISDNLRSSPTITITRDEIVVSGRFVMKVSEAEASPKQELPKLSAALRQAALDMNIALPAKDNTSRPEVTVVGDKTIPYSLLRKILATATAAGFETLSLAVVHTAEQA